MIRAVRLVRRSAQLANTFSLRSLVHAEMRPERASSSSSPLPLDDPFLKPSSPSSSSGDNRVRIEDFYKEHQIKLLGSEASSFLPFFDFDSTPFAPKLQKSLKSQGYTSPTPIQSVAWSVASQGRDLIAVAKTGSGKTCGFLLPALHIIGSNLENASTSSSNSDVRKSRSRLRAYRAPSVLILAPTRELAVQIEVEAKKFASITGMTAGCVYGGASRNGQIDMLRRGIDIVIATPGRCNDLAEMGALNLSQVNYLVMDEADRMLDMGFEVS